MKKPLKILLAVTAVNFGVFGFLFFSIGGSAVGGRTENGRCYLRNKSEYTEVSRGTFLYSYCHTLLTAALFLST